MAGCEALLAAIVRDIPESDLLPLLQAMPVPGRIEHKRWIIRHTDSLAGPGARDVPVGDANKVAELLGLNRDTLMAIAAYHVPGEAAPNVVWVVQYDRPVEARLAYIRYRDFLDTARQPWAQVTLVRTPKGACLCGSWTAELESISQVLPRLDAALP